MFEDDGDMRCTVYSAPKSKTLPSKVLYYFFFPDVFRQVSDPQMARFTHHSVQQYSTLLGLSFQICSEVKYSCEISIFLINFRNSEKSRVRVILLPASDDGSQFERKI